MMQRGSSWISKIQPLAKSGLGPWLAIGVLSVAIAATGYADFLKAVATKESSMNAGVTNSLGYVGLFQMGTAAMTDAGYYKSNGTASNSWQGTFTGKNGVTSLAQFKASPDLQVQAITDYYNKLQSYVDYYGLNQYVGKTVNGVPITESGLVAGAHLVGIGSLKQYLESGGSVIPKDGNGVPVTQYITQFGGYTMSKTAPSYAQVVAATPTGSVVAQPQQPQQPQIPVGNAPGPNLNAVFPSQSTDSMTPDDAFAARTGYTMWQVGDFFKQAFAAMLFVWGAHLVRGGWAQFREGKSTLPEIAHENMRALIVVSLFMLMLI